MPPGGVSFEPDHIIDYFTPVSLKESINNDVKAAMRAKDREKTGTLRLIMSAIKQIEVDERRTLNDEDVIAILTRMVKQHEDSIAQYTQGNRPDLVQKEQSELEIIQAWLPTPLSNEQISTMIEQAITDSDARSMKDMGKVMASLKNQIQGRADMGQVSSQVKARLSPPVDR